MQYEPLRFWAVVFCLFAGSACEGSPPPSPKINTPRPVDAGLLTFDTPDLQKRFVAFDAAAREYAGKDFDYQPYQLGGNFVTAVWAKGAGFTEPCTLRGPRESLKAIHRISVDTIVIPFPRAKSAAIRVETVAPNPDDWCVIFDYREATEQPVTSRGWGIKFFRWAPSLSGAVVPFRPYEHAKEVIELPVWGYGVRNSGVRLPGTPALPDSFIRHIRSPQAMRDAYLADLARLQELAVSFIREHKAGKRVYEKYQGDGLPPRYKHVPLTPEEETAEIANAKRFFATQAKLMQDHHKAMYAALRKSFPIERCWVELKEK